MADQSHIIREFKGFSGFSPKAFLRHDVNYANTTPNAPINGPVGAASLQLIRSVLFYFLVVVLVNFVAVRDELFSDDPPVAAVSAANAMDNLLRLESLEKLRRLHRDHGEEIEVFGYHDPAEFKQ